MTNKSDDYFKRLLESYNKPSEASFSKLTVKSLRKKVVQQ
jgi:hypothetical protein